MMIEDVLGFWFGDLVGPYDFDASKNPLWWMGLPEDDLQIRTRFGALVERALRGELSDWAQSARGALALVIVLDQFTRTLGRGTAAAFDGDAKALAVCLAAIDGGQDKALRGIERGFFYMPMMHAEDRAVAERSVAVFAALGEETAAAVEGHPNSHSAAVQHAEIVLEFGRYPHRNALLGRTATPEELAFLDDGGPSFGQSKK